MLSAPAPGGGGASLLYVPRYGADFGPSPFQWIMPWVPRPGGGGGGGGCVYLCDVAFVPSLIQGAIPRASVKSQVTPEAGAWGQQTLPGFPPARMPGYDSSPTLTQGGGRAEESFTLIMAILPTRLKES